MADDETSIEIVARQLAELTSKVEEMASNARLSQDRADIQQERIEQAARELIEVSARLQAAASALRPEV